MNLSAGGKIDIRQTGQLPPHIEYSIPADQPDVYYDSTTQEITIDGDDYGYVNYYDVVIMSQTTWDVVISTQVDGDYDTIDVSSLPTGEYVITIYSPLNNTFEGFFEIE